MVVKTCRKCNCDWEEEHISKVILLAPNETDIHNINESSYGKGRQSEIDFAIIKYGLKKEVI